MNKKVVSAIVLLQKLRMIQSGIKLADPIEITMLHRIALYQAHQEALAVTNILKWKDIGSCATLHGRLLAMVKSKLLLMNGSEDDGRIRYIVLAPLAEQYFSLIGEAITAPNKILGRGKTLK